MRTGQGHIIIVAAERCPRTPRHRPLQWKILMIHSPELDQLNQCHCVRETVMNYAVYCTVFAILYIHIRACFPGDFLCANCLQLVLVLVLAVATAGSVPLSTLVVGAEASYASTPRGGRLSGQAAKLGRWWRARKNGDWFRTLQSRKSQYCSQYTCINVLQRVEIYCPEYAGR